MEESKFYEFVRGHLTVNSGPMFSGKTSVLTETLNRYADLGFPTLYINSSKDTRSDKGISTHNSGGNNLSKKVDKLSVQNLSNVDASLLSKFKVIGIDEAQFFSGLCNTVLDWVDAQKKIVHVVGLDLYANRQKWGEIADLFPQADSAFKLTAKCLDCLDLGQGVIEAPFTSRIVPKGPLEDIGGSDKYLPVCRKHWNIRNDN